ncbi:helix-turn-helix transcriptional regulator [Rhodococcus daqingensis]|uniref:Helix-turn-helix transcriptional regulator n=1 Tax=Rhodococcus daqingensis TaxID=2479363 RepID=A0ABW2S332_9NOCA
MKPIIIDEDTGRRLWRVVECSEHTGIAGTSWRAYVAKGIAPQPIAHLDARTPLWDAEEVQTFERDRPGVAGRPRTRSSAGT